MQGTWLASPAGATPLIPFQFPAPRSYDYFQPQGLTAEQQQLFKFIEDADL